MKNSLSLINVIIMHYIKFMNLAMRYRLDQQSFSSMLYLVSMVPLSQKHSTSFNILIGGMLQLIQQE